MRRRRACKVGQRWPVSKCASRFYLKQKILPGNLAPYCDAARRCNRAVLLQQHLAGCLKGTAVPQKQLRPHTGAGAGVNIGNLGGHREAAMLHRHRPLCARIARAIFEVALNNTVTKTPGFMAGFQAACGAFTTRAKASIIG